jgi:glycosyltransferase involved in cell wall biosynthesis
MAKVSCVMPTYRRFTCVERSIACFLAQETTLDTELIIYNTDVNHCLSLDQSFSTDELARIKIVNNNIDSKTGQEYSNTGAIRRDALTHATGNYYITWDDDDIFFPWNIEQCYHGLQRTGARAWKPYQSFIWTNSSRPSLEYNYLEATAMIYIEEVTFDETTGPENLSWFNRLRDQGQLSEDPHSIPAYCFYWKDPPDVGGQKQSGYINHADNFSMHMEMTKDYATRPLTKRKLSHYRELFSVFDHEFNMLPKDKEELILQYVNPDYYLW